MFWKTQIYAKKKAGTPHKMCSDRASYHLLMYFSPGFIGGEGAGM